MEEEKKHQANYYVWLNDRYVYVLLASLATKYSFSILNYVFYFSDGVSMNFSKFRTQLPSKLVNYEIKQLG